MQRMFIKKLFLFTVGSVCRVKRFTTGSRRNYLGGKHFVGDEEVEAEVLRQQLKRLLCCGFQRTGKTMGQLHQ
jgi:hypothetical protein